MCGETRQALNKGRCLTCRARLPRPQAQSLEVQMRILARIASGVDRNEVLLADKETAARAASALLKQAQ